MMNKRLNCLRAGVGTSSGSLLAVSGAGAGSGSVPEAPDLVAGLDDLAMVGKRVEEHHGHLWVAEVCLLPK